MKNESRTTIKSLRRRCGFKNDKNIQKKGIRDTADWENREEYPSASKNCKKSKAETQLSEILLK